MTVDDNIASADLQNPSDALEFLANVADRAEGAQNQLPPISGYFQGHRTPLAALPGSGTMASSEHTGRATYVQFPPLQRGQLNLEVMHELLRRHVSHHRPRLSLFDANIL